MWFAVIFFSIVAICAVGSVWESRRRRALYSGRRTATPGDVGSYGATGHGTYGADSGSAFSGDCGSSGGFDGGGGGGGDGGGGGC